MHKLLIGSRVQRWLQRKFGRKPWPGAFICDALIAVPADLQPHNPTARCGICWNQPYNPILLPCVLAHVFCKQCITDWLGQGTNTCPCDQEQLFNTERATIFQESEHLTFHKDHLNIYDPFHVSEQEMRRLGVDPRLAESFSAFRKMILEQDKVTVRYEWYIEHHVAIQRRLDLVLSKF